MTIASLRATLVSFSSLAPLGHPISAIVPSTVHWQTNPAMLAANARTAQVLPHTCFARAGNHRTHKCTPVAPGSLETQPSIDDRLLPTIAEQERCPPLASSKASHSLHKPKPDGTDLRRFDWSDPPPNLREGIELVPDPKESHAGRVAPPAISDHQGCSSRAIQRAAY